MEARCETKRLDDENKARYWNTISYVDPGDVDSENPVGQTVYAKDRWVCADNKVATTQAICDKIDDEFEERAVTEDDQKQGRWLRDTSEKDSDEYFATTAAITAGFIIYFRMRFYFKSTLLSTTCTGFFKITIARVAILITKLRVVITIISCMVDPQI